MQIFLTDTWAQYTFAFVLAGAVLVASGYFAFQQVMGLLESRRSDSYASQYGVKTSLGEVGFGLGGFLFVVTLLLIVTYIVYVDIWLPGWRGEVTALLADTGGYSAEVLLADGSTAEKNIGVELYGEILGRFYKDHVGNTVEAIETKVWKLPALVCIQKQANSYETEFC